MGAAAATFAPEVGGSDPTVVVVAVVRLLVDVMFASHQRVLVELAAALVDVSFASHQRVLVTVVAGVHTGPAPMNPSSAE